MCCVTVRSVILPLFPALAALLTACGGGSRDATPAAQPEPSNAVAEISAPAKSGETTYGQICASCHQATGIGVEGTFPPLKGSTWLLGKPEIPIAIVIAGLQGDILVDGKPFAGAMQPWGMLSDDDVANVLTYARSQWGNAGTAVTASQVKAVRENIGSRSAWTAAELQKAYPGAGS